ncbi:hypothetical protein FRB94_008830 [Tulasnella sp. JGI-2019a]|nr:hypothetical protein FRB93_012907 [Tulasnella sp. JGI-2019a]KAG9011230.1 hypothetical protein FRB94_008830 [Tulasnella sp. JGI-2019a]KAG9035325.1 hypothetical protein FRB95_011475 [Tulasnella sp. JGI-2019a]
MAVLYAPVPSYPIIDQHSGSPSSSGSSSSSPTSQQLPQLTRHVSRSERMLLTALRRADEAQQQLQYNHSSSTVSSSSNNTSHHDSDYFSPSTIASGKRSSYQSPNKLSPPILSTATYLLPPHQQSEAMRSRSPSPMAMRREGRSPRSRTSSPSPHPYRPASPRTIASPPHLSRHQTAPAHHLSRPITPSQEFHHRQSSSPVRPAPRLHSRRESGSMAPGTSASAAAYAKQMSAHEQYLRARLEGVLAASTPRTQPQDAHMVDVYPVTSPNKNTLSRGPSVSRTVPTNHGATVSGDQWTWSNNTSAPVIQLANAPTSPKMNAKLSTRSPSSSNLIPAGVASPSRLRQNSQSNNAMITPPPSPPYRGTSGAPNLSTTSGPTGASTSTSNTPSRAPSQARSGLGHGHPSRGSSAKPNSSRTSPMPEGEEGIRQQQQQMVFDARSASLALKNQHGYVSFCEVAGLGEPEGMFDDERADGDDGTEGSDERRGRWWEVWRK